MTFALKLRAMLPAVSDLQTAAPRDDGGRPLSRAEQAAALGISVRHLYRLLAAERAGAAGWVRPEPAPDPVPEAPPAPVPGPPARRGVEDLPYVELARASRRRWYYNLDDDDRSRLPGGPFRVGTGRGGWLQVAHRDDDRTAKDGDAGEAPASEGRCVNDEDRAAGVVYVQAAPR
jgi:hypothetical protein